MNSGAIDSIKNELESKGIKIELGVVNRTGFFGEMKSFYVRDPGGNLIEFSSYDNDIQYVISGT